MVLTRNRIVAARAVGVIADAVQLGLFPLFWPGALSTAEDILDVVVAVVMFALVGWHWAFIPAFLSELVPGFDLVPTWTAAAFLATRQAAEPSVGAAGAGRPLLEPKPPALPPKGA
ncbi:MAG: hypothetical protein ACHQNV_02255 [Vicinamibacteria bacterium]